VTVSAALDQFAEIRCEPFGSALSSVAPRLAGERAPSVLSSEKKAMLAVPDRCDIYGGRDPISIPADSLPEVSHLLHLAPATARSWLLGRSYPTQAGAGDWEVSGRRRDCLTVTVPAYMFW
jgi:hypothetical protein